MSSDANMSALIRNPEVAKVCFTGSVNGGSVNGVYFAAGVQDEAHGLFGVLSIPEPASLALFAAGLFGIGEHHDAACAVGHP